VRWAASSFKFFITDTFRVCRDEDGFLYVTYSGENTFGADL